MTFFKNTNIFTYFYLVLYLQLIRSEGAYKLEVQLAYLVDFAQFLSWCAPHFTFLHSKLQSYTAWNYFLQEYIYIYFFFLVLYLQLVGFSEAQKILSVRGIACIFNRLRPIFITVCFEFYFSAFHLVLHYIRIIFFFMSIFLFLDRVPLAGRILRGSENSTGQR